MLTNVTTYNMEILNAEKWFTKREFGAAFSTFQSRGGDLL
jgi:hypothetical protein